MEGLMQSLKTNDAKRQILVCGLSKKDAKKRSTATWKKEQNVYWNGRTYNRPGKHYLFLIRRDYRAMANLCPKFRNALKALAPNACLTRWERLTRARQSLLCDILTELKNDL